MQRICIGSYRDHYHTNKCLLLINGAEWVGGLLQPSLFDGEPQNNPCWDSVTPPHLHYIAFCHFFLTPFCADLQKVVQMYGSCLEDFGLKVQSQSGLWLVDWLVQKVQSSTACSCHSLGLFNEIIEEGLVGGLVG